MARRDAGKTSGRRAAIYARFSSHNQRSESIEIQVENCRAYCAERGLEVVEEYCDYAQTGRDTNRAGFQRMLKDAAGRKFDHLVIYKVTRIMRNRDEMALARLTLRRHGVDILYAGEQIGEGSSGVLQLGLLEVLAEWESAILSERVRDGIAKNASQCKANGHLMYGWDIRDGYYVVNERERAALAKAKDVVMRGGSVAEAVRAMGPHRTKQGKPFGQQSLTNMLRRPQNAGTYMYAGYVKEGGMPALWSREEQVMLEHVLNGGAPHPKGYEGYERYVLTGKLFHEHDGELFACHGTSGTGRNKVRYRYYTCRRCRRSVRAERIEEEVSQMVLDALRDPGLRERIADLMVERSEEERGPSLADSIRDELHEIELAYGRIWSAIEQGVAPPGGGERVADLKERQRVLEDELAVAEAMDRLRLDRDRVLFWLEDMSRATPEQIIEVFVSRVIVTEDGRRHAILLVDEEAPPDSLPELGEDDSLKFKRARPRIRGAAGRPAAFFVCGVGDLLGAICLVLAESWGYIKESLGAFATLWGKWPYERDQMGAVL